METCFCEGGMETEVKLDGDRNEISGDGGKMCVNSVPYRLPVSSAIDGCVHNA